MSTSHDSITVKDLRGAKTLDHPQHDHDWTDYLDTARGLVAGARSRYGIPGLDIRAEGDAGGAGDGGDGGDAGDGGGGDDGDAGGVDLSNPQVQTAIRAAEQRGRKAADESIKALEAKRDELLDELKPLKKIAGNASELEKRLKRLDELENERKASEAGSEPEKFRSAVESAAKEKADEIVRQYRELDVAKDTKIQELEGSLEEMKTSDHRRFVMNSILKASIPDDVRVIREGAEDYLLDTLAPMVKPVKVDGIGEVARIERNGALIENINGKSPDGLMDLRELFSLARQGKGPLPRIGMFLVSNGSGSGTQRPDGTTSSPGNWWKMSAEQRAKYAGEHGAAAAQELMEKSPKPKAGEVA